MLFNWPKENQMTEGKWIQVWFLDSYSSESHLPTSKMPAFHRGCSRVGFEPVHREPVNCLLPSCSSGSLFAFSVTGLYILVGIPLNLAKAFSHIRTRRCCELSAGLGKQHGCETDEKTQEEHQRFPPTELALHGQTCFFFSEVTACWLASISAVVCEALALEQRAWELVQRLECKCWNDAEMLQYWPKLFGLMFAKGTFGIGYIVLVMW